MNSYVKWIFVVLLICSLTAFVERDKPTGGLSEGDVAPVSYTHLDVYKRQRLRNRSLTTEPLCVVLIQS